MSKRERTRTEQRILNAIGEMPFGALLEVHSYAQPMRKDGEITLDMVADYLEALRGAVARYVGEYERDKHELAQYRADVAGMRRLLGL